MLGPKKAKLAIALLSYHTQKKVPIFYFGILSPLEKDLGNFLATPICPPPHPNRSTLPLPPSSFPACLSHKGVYSL